MARYNRRDSYKHFIRKEQRVNQPCTHACCRGYRPHPENYPHVMPARYLRGASDDQLARHYHRCDEAGGRKAQACRDQVLHELHRRDVREERREAVEERRRLRAQYNQRQKQFKAEEIERQWLAAEAATKGNMLNRRGREAGVDERTLFRGPEARARKYASEELLNWWEDHPRPTEAYFRGRESRIGYYQSGPRRRLTSAEQQERDWYERVDAEERERTA